MERVEQIFLETVSIHFLSSTQTLLQSKQFQMKLFDQHEHLLLGSQTRIGFVLAKNPKD